jgi:FAD/FMN-containing dehydrogenase/Fe-S oxidoreductase
MQSNLELEKSLKDESSRLGVECEARFDLATRLLYSTDASIYQVEPLGVVFPKHIDDLAGIVNIASNLGVPILARGAGSSLAGQAIGRALIVDCSRYLSQIIEINPETLTAVVEPGVVLNTINKALLPYNLQFGPDPASAERATLGGSIANNAAGAHSLLYGMTADHLLSADVVLSDGTQATWGPVSLKEAEYRSQEKSVQADIYRAALHIRREYSTPIREHWPRTWRRASGYNLNYLLPWSPSRPPQWSTGSAAWAQLSGHPIPYPPVDEGSLNLAPLLAGSEGTLAVLRKATLRLVHRPRRTILGVLGFPDISSACDCVPDLLELLPSAIELIPPRLISLARSVPAYASQLSFLDGVRSTNDGQATLLVVEFSGNNSGSLKEMVTRLGPDVLTAETEQAQKQVWAVRKVGLGILMSQPGAVKPIAFIEDLSVPVEHLGEFVRQMEAILSANGTRGDFYAHASVGCLHIRPLVDLKSPGGIAGLRKIAEQSVELVLSLGGTVSGEHGNGMSRGEWLGREFGEQINTAFRQLKQAADPQGRLNPGKIVDPPALDRDLRYSNSYKGEPWKPTLNFFNTGSEGLQDAIELCNGAGVCRKSEGVMCPSFQASHDEMHSTRGRANLLRLLISDRFPTWQAGEKTVREALDLCLACKGCKAECPSGVDVAKLKYEFTDHYYTSHSRSVRDYLFGYIGSLARWGHPFARLVNPIMGSRLFAATSERLIGLAHQRSFPRLAERSLTASLPSKLEPTTGPEETVLFLSDAFTEYFFPEAGLAAVRTLIACGCRVRMLPVLGAGRTLISKGFLKPAQQHALRLVQAIQRLDPTGSLPIIGVEPSEIYTLRDELPDLLPGDCSADGLGARSFMIDEFLIRPDGEPDEPGQKFISRMATIQGLGKPAASGKVLLHGHCYQKAQPPAADGHPSGVNATLAMLKAAGYQVSLIDSSCCGMAGAFGYEAEHYEFSKTVAEMKLLPVVRAASSDTIVAACGISCQAQIEDGTGRPALHPIILVDRLLNQGTP